MSPVARQELRDFAARVRERRAKEQPPKQPWTFADKTDAVVFVLCMIGAVVLMGLGL